MTATPTPMQMPDPQVAVIGAGLGGLYAARLLARAGIDFVVLEAQRRLGGRVLSERLDEASPSRGSYDLGPTWFWPAFQPRLPRLLEALGIASFRQHDAGDFVYEASQSTIERIADAFEPGESLRIAGGMQTLVDALAAEIDPSRICRGTRVVSIRRVDEGIDLAWARSDRAMGTLRARQVISTLPPRLLAEGLTWQPALPAAVLDDWSAVPTWMAGQAKFVAVYATPFWKAAGLSGHAQSRVGPLVEIHDASPLQGLPALFGFAGLPPASRRQAGDDLEPLVLAQLQRLFGRQAAQPVATFYKDWSADAFVATARDEVAAQSHPAYGRQAALPADWQRAFVLAGTEAARAAGGYLEGALEASEAAVARVLALAPG